MIDKVPNLVLKEEVIKKYETIFAPYQVKTHLVIKGPVDYLCSISEAKQQGGKPHPVEIRKKQIDTTKMLQAINFIKSINKHEFMACFEDTDNQRKNSVELIVE